ncbi:MAG: hypothetical protein ACO3QC_02980 [Phycisphaerales bacterium]
MTVSARKVASLTAIAIAVGILATLACAFLPVLLVERGHGARITTVHRGSHGWWNARDEVFGMQWSNLQLMDETLSSPLDDGELPAWAEPPPPPYPEGPILRVGTLALGWPKPVLRLRWTVATLKQNFPMPAEIDDQDTSIVYAAEDFMQRNRGGGPQERTVLWSGALFNTAMFACVAAALLRIGLRFTRRAAQAEAP